MRGVPSTWSEWECVEECGETSEYRNRTCLPDPSYPADEVELCPPQCDDLSDERECYAGCCIPDGGFGNNGNPDSGIWTQWSTWDCDRTCGTGTESRSRSCVRDPADVYEDCPLVCTGDDNQQRPCFKTCCYHDGVPSSWSDWECLAECGDTV